MLPGVPVWSLALAGALLGAIVGSFVATLVLRLPEGRTLGGRSACDACGHRLTPLELVPLLSFLLLRGRCRKCAAAIHLRHPVTEIAAAAIGALAFALVPGWEGLLGALFGWTLLALALLDAEHFWLPDMLTLPLMAAGFAGSLLIADPSSVDRFAGAVVGYAALTLIAWGYERLRGRTGIGGGDPKLFAAIGAWLGWQALPMVLLCASLAGLFIVGVAMMGGREVRAETRVPLGSLLALAAWPIWLAGAAA